MNTSTALQAAITATWLMYPTPAATDALAVSSAKWFRSAQALARLASSRGTAAESYEIGSPDADGENIGSSDRETTPSEHLIGEIREWALLQADWDGAGASVPSADSLSLAVKFVRLLGKSPLPRPMLHPNGRAGLFWREGALRADLEFYPDGRVTFYAERARDKFKGVAEFDGESMPAVFPAFLVA